jgi:acyl carrier protein
VDALTLAQKLVASCLQLGDQAGQLDGNTQLLGGFPEFNSLTITAIVSSIEDELDCDVDDEEISGEIFETLGTLASFIDGKMS